MIGSAPSSGDTECPAVRGEARRGDKGVRTRHRILVAARRTFAKLGYERATIRAIAAEAEVDKSSVMQYFGSKKDLFREAVHWHIPIDELISSDPDETAENCLRGLLENWSADPDSPMAVLLRTSMTSDDAADILREHIGEEAVGQVASIVDADDARLRAAVFSAMMMGIASHRYLLRMPDLAEADIEDIVGLVKPMLSSLLWGGK